VEEGSAQLINPSKTGYWGSKFRENFLGNRTDRPTFSGMGQSITYALLSIGVNATPGGSDVLRRASMDAVRFGLAVTSAKGAIPPRNAKYLLSDTTRKDLDRDLDALARRPPTFLMLFFAGHGNAGGIGLSDGLYSFTRLRAKLAAIAAQGIVVVLDSCESGGMTKGGTVLGGVFEQVDMRWGAALLAVEPGIRIFMASRHDESTYEGANGGWFVSALLRAMFAVERGDRVVGEREYFTDQFVFSRAHVIMTELGVTPQSEGLWGDFPLMESNATPAGRVQLAVSAVPNLSIIANAVAVGRRHLPTTIIGTATDAFGNVLPAQQARFLPMGDSHPHRIRFEVDLGISPGCQLQLWRYGSCRVIWNVTGCDAEGRVIGRRREVVDYHNEQRFTWR
jgi:hypothetical protein